MKKYLLSLVLSLLFIPVTVWGQNTAAKGLSSRLDTLIKYQLPVGSNVGISIYDLTDGKSLYTYQADKLSRPASTMKLLTTISALSHPDADDDGYVTGPNVNIITEMTNMIDASRAWEANSTAFNASKSIALKGLELGN